MDDDAIRRLEQARDRVEAADNKLAEARTERRQAIVDGHAHGLSMNRMAKVLGITRQRVRDILREEGRI